MKKILLLVLIAILLSGTLFSQTEIENIYSGKVLEFDSKFLKEKKRIFVHLPDDFKNKSYPVIYLIGSTPNDFRAAVCQGQFIVIGIENNNPKKYFVGEQNRDNYFSFLERELIPFVEAEYKTSPVKFITGHSISGGFVIDIFNRFPGFFSFYIATSPAIHMLNLTVEKTILTKPVYLYFVIGSRENYEQLEKANNRLFTILDSLKIKNLKWKYEVLDGETHETNEFTGFCRGYSFYKSFSTIPDSLLSKNIRSIIEYVNDVNNQFGDKIEIGESVFMQNLLINLNAGNHKNVLDALKNIANEHPDFFIDESKTMIDIADDIRNKGNYAVAKQAYQLIYEKTKSETVLEKIKELYWEK